MESAFFRNMDKHTDLNCDIILNNACRGKIIPIDKNNMKNDANEKSTKNDNIKYIILRNKYNTRNIFCSCTNDNISIQKFMEKIYSFMALDKNRFDIFIYGNDKEEINNYRSIQEIFKKIKNDKEYYKKSKVFPKYRNYILILTYEIVERRDYLFNMFNNSIEKKYQTEKKEKINIYLFGKQPIILDVTMNFTISEIKFLIYELENIPIEDQIIVPLNEKNVRKEIFDLDKNKNYTLYIKQNFNKQFFSPQICLNINFNNINDYHIDIDLNDKSDFFL
jgi:hypothetical protein